MSSNKYKGLPIIQTKNAVPSAKLRINEERSGKQLGLYCRWNRLNKAMLKYWRFNQVTMMGGMSGSGKSFILNMLRTDFLDNEDWKITASDDIYLGNSFVDCIYDAKTDTFHFPRSENDQQLLNARIHLEAGLWQLWDNDEYFFHRAINRDCTFEVVALHFGYEMEPEDELIRSSSTVVGKSFGYIMSSETELIDGREEIKYLSDREYNIISEALDIFTGRKEYYVAISGNVEQMMKTVEGVVEVNPNAMLIITVDHTLLSKKLNERDDAELQAAIARFAIDCRQRYGCMIILLNQLNQNIERTERRTKPVLHYPIKSDLHQGAQVWWACDNVIIFHRPELLNIDRYGVGKLNSKDLVHAAVIKSRRGRTGDILMKNDFVHGRLIEKSASDFK